MRAIYCVSVLALFALAGCGEAKEDNQASETRMDDLDSLEGTISDDMINLDESTDEAPLEPTSAAEGSAAAKDDKDAAAKPDEPAPTKTDGKAAAE